jgi:aldose sugar dehydrogenase
MTGLQNPWGLAFTTDGALLYTERGKGLSVRRSDGSTALLFKPSDMVAEGQSGMQGVALDPQFSTNRTLYVYMSSSAGGPKDNRVVRLTVDANYTAVANRQDIVTGISYKITPSAGAPAGAGAHSGGRVRFGPDNLLYITTGDNHNAVVPQSKTELGGKVLRVDRDGAAATGNNPPAGFDPRVFAYGFRNPQGIAFRPGNGQVFTAEHGPGHTDEVTLVTNGGNAGWDPGCLNDSNAYCGYGSNQSNGSVTPMTDLNKFPNAMRPTWNNGGASAGIAGNTFLSGSQWKLWDGAMAVAFMNGAKIEILRLNANGTLLSNTALPQGGVRIRALTQGPDGNLYAATDNKSGGDEIWKLTPQ